MFRVFVVDSRCLKKQEIKRTMFIIFCQHMPTQREKQKYGEMLFPYFTDTSPMPVNINMSYLVHKNASLT
jgi:hypothetical protein